MTTVLLWGDRWWLPHHQLPVPFAELSQAAGMLAAAWPANGRTIRLIYQPDDFATVPVECPNGNRATLAAILAEEHPVVLHPGHVWGYEPIMGADGGFNTLLHHERRPAFFALVQQLEEHGFNVASAWPLATWLTALPPELSDSGAMTLVALHADRYCVYRHSPVGSRAVHTGQGPEMLGKVAELLMPVFSQSPGEFVLFVTTDDTYIDRLNEKLTPAANQMIGLFMLWEALAKAAPLPSKHPAQLLPALPRLTAARTVAAVSILLLVVASVSGAWQIRDHFAAQAAGAARATEAADLQEEVVHLRTNAEEIAVCRATVAKARRLPVEEMLGELATLPAVVALASLKLTEDGFILTGGVAPGGRQEAEVWIERLGQVSRPWQVAVGTEPSEDILQLTGAFRP